VHRQAMAQALGLVSLLVRDYDEALSFHVGTLGFRLIEDAEVPDGPETVRIAGAESTIS
jgi:catechol 2,3-dioxygenase-like lactoylglutathione lyase family enzyme